MSLMRAKLRVNSVERSEGSEHIKMNAVAADSYPADGTDENNTYARWSPTASFELQCCNPDLFGKLNPGDEFYVDFTLAPKKQPPTMDAA